MKIGLVRHFKVNMNTDTGNINSRLFDKLQTEYNSIDVIPKEVDLRDINWNKCYASNMPRAITTAKTIYNGEIIQNELIREVDIRFTREIEGEYDYHTWGFHSILGWGKNASYVSETYKESKERVLRFLSILEKDIRTGDNTLLVCHGLIMRVLEEGLREFGFDGETIVAPDNGDLYLFEKNNK